MLGAPLPSVLTAENVKMRPLGLAAGDMRHQMLGLRTHGGVTLDTIR